MTEPERPTGGTHRSSSRSDRLPVLIGSLIAIAVVAVAVTVVLDARGEPAHRSAPPAAVSSTPPAASPTPAPSGNTPSPTGQAISPTSPASTLGSIAPQPSTPQTATPGQGGNPAPSAPLDVLNDSRITGLAHRAADQFRAAGWEVVLIGNFTGGQDVPETTIFFPDGGQAAAERLAARFGVDRVLPAPSFLSASHLSVVLARDWGEAR